MLKRYTIVLLTRFGLAGAAGAETPADFLQAFEREVRTQAPDFDGFSADRGRTFFTTPQTQDWTGGPRPAGRHPGVLGRPVWLIPAGLPPLAARQPPPGPKESIVRDNLFPATGGVSLPAQRSGLRAFWLGHRYQRHLAALWPLARHPQLEGRSSGAGSTRFKVVFSLAP